MRPYLDRPVTQVCNYQADHWPPGIDHDIVRGTITTVPFSVTGSSYPGTTHHDLARNARYTPRDNSQGIGL
jgi:hypothetical protein